MPFPQPEIPGGFDHSADLDRDFRCAGDYQRLSDDGLFIGQTDGFFDMVRKLAREADEATRKCDAD